jgi:hypothetical protein
MHLLLILVHVLDDDDVLAAESVVVEELLDGMHVGSQTRSDEAELAGGDEVAAFERARRRDGVDRRLPDRFKNGLDDVQKNMRGEKKHFLNNYFKVKKLKISFPRKKPENKKDFCC